jgi:hypothetical protein
MERAGCGGMNCLILTMNRARALLTTQDTHAHIVLELETLLPRLRGSASRTRRRLENEALKERLAYFKAITTGAEHAAIDAALRGEGEK